jgi:phosphoribosyl 1,2-cyclic phosphate phosphodiesterase
MLDTPYYPLAVASPSLHPAVKLPRFTFLGTGTSGGIPLIACDCPVCTSADPRDTRTRTGACVRWIDSAGIERVVLIDATPDLHAQARREGLWRCDAILFTHNHVDHIFGLDEVRRFNAVMRAPIDVYAEGYVLESLRRVYKHVFEAASNVNDSFVATLIAHEVPPPGTPGSGPIDLFGMRFEPVRLLHGRLPILGFRIGPVGESRVSGRVVEWSSGQVGDGSDGDGLADAASPKALGHSTTRPLDHSHPPFPLAYCTDVSAIPPETWGRLTGLRTLVLDALRLRHHPTHLTLDQAVGIAERVAAERTYFVHMAHELGHAATEESLPESMRLAYDGLTLGELPPAGSAWRPVKRGGAGAGDKTARFEEG